ncbi:MAG TPA: hypothetical protein VGJ28_06820 [Micromonosporaceae bacterium]
MGRTILSVLLFALVTIGLSPTAAMATGTRPTPAAPGFAERFSSPSSAGRLSLPSSAGRVAFPSSLPAPSPSPVDRQRSATHPAAPAPVPQAPPIAARAALPKQSGLPGQQAVPADGINAVRAGLAHDLTTDVVSGRWSGSGHSPSPSGVTLGAAAAARTAAIRARAAKVAADKKVAVAARERLNHSMVYSGTVALLIASTGLLMLGLRRRQW